MNNADRPAFPADTDRLPSGAYGLTKREYFAALAMQGLLAGSNWPGVVIGPCQIADHAVEFADALLAELDKPK